MLVDKKKLAHASVFVRSTLSVTRVAEPDTDYKLVSWRTAPQFLFLAARRSVRVFRFSS